MNQSQKAEQFAELHVKGKPLVLYNAWDAGSAKAILETGAKAVATSSWSVAAAQGYRDGESIPLPFVEQIIARIAASVEAPLTVDFEGGYSESEDGLADNIGRLIDVGVVGVNFEDRVVNGKGLYPVDRQAKRIAALRKAADIKHVPLFINARSDVFFQDGDPKTFVDDAEQRGRAYAAAGASGFFLPGLTDEALIGRLSESVSLPLNIMVMEGVPSNARLAELGVSRISYGPIPYIETIGALKQKAKRIYA
jgi:2-methylisocitrate lyase-like PEP mutase family enzyme